MIAEDIVKNNGSGISTPMRITVKEPVECEIVERKSRFIANLAPVKDERSALDFVAEIKKKYPDATHNVFGYFIDFGTYARYSDDGEPQGTAGMPVLNAIKMSGLTDICTVVTRYFGGILLGAGGLVRAYSSAAAAALSAGERVVFEPYLICRINVTYSEYQKLGASFAIIGALEESADFGADVTVDVSVKKVDFDKLCALVADMTSGREHTQILEETERPTPVK